MKYLDNQLKPRKVCPYCGGINTQVEDFNVLFGCLDCDSAWFEGNDGWWAGNKSGPIKEA